MTGKKHMCVNEDTSYYLGAGHEEIKLGLNWKHSLCWLVFTVLGGSIQAAGG